jgi:hypothetical protein
MNNLRRAIVFAMTMSILATIAEAKPRPAEAGPQAQVLPAQPPPPPPNDTALFLAGMPLPNNSPLAPLTRDAAWTTHARYFENAFSKLNKTKFQKLHDWQNAFLPESLEQIPVVYYMFSGPDFLYMDQFFPNASTYIMCGQEAIGPAPDPLHMPNLAGAFANLENAMKSSLTATYFVTQDMKVDLQSQELKGTLPILYVFLARAGKSIREVQFGSLASGGEFRESRPGSGGTPGVRISYIDNPTGKQQTLFYFTTDISNGGIGSNPAFMNFCNAHGVGASFLKSSSYLMFEDSFSRVRDFILNHSHMIVQDDSGVPIRFFDPKKWNLRLFGTYVGTLDIFRQNYQPRLSEMYQTMNPAPFGIGFGYQWDYRKANLIVAQRQ